MFAVQIWQTLWAMLSRVASQLRFGTTDPPNVFFACIPANGSGSHSDDMLCDNMIIISALFAYFVMVLAFSLLFAVLVGSSLSCLRFRDEFEMVSELVVLRTRSPEEQLETVLRFCPELEGKVACRDEKTMGLDLAEREKSRRDLIAAMT
ncbi:hypothetical protein DL98DRAFT_580341 [Cadophora sp. DSE1049]|nr:hypothetical protein DL98DRAFT_580341 [Cadophora sp. DSE1049]